MSALPQYPSRADYDLKEWQGGERIKTLRDNWYKPNANIEGADPVVKPGKLGVVARVQYEPALGVKWSYFVRLDDFGDYEFRVVAAAIERVQQNGEPIVDSRGPWTPCRRVN